MQLLPKSKREPQTPPLCYEKQVDRNTNRTLPPLPSPQISQDAAVAQGGPPKTTSPYRRERDENIEIVHTQPEPTPRLIPPALLRQPGNNEPATPDPANQALPRNNPSTNLMGGFRVFPKIES
jgi:hypothetical protein